MATRGRSLVAFSYDAGSKQTLNGYKSKCEKLVYYISWQPSQSRCAFDVSECFGKLAKMRTFLLYSEMPNYSTASNSTLIQLGDYIL